MKELFTLLSLTNKIIFKDEDLFLKHFYKDNKVFIIIFS